MYEQMKIWVNYPVQLKFGYPRISQINVTTALTTIKKVT